MTRPSDPRIDDLRKLLVASLTDAGKLAAAGTDYEAQLVFIDRIAGHLAYAYERLDQLHDEAATQVMSLQRRAVNGPVSAADLTAPARVVCLQEFLSEAGRRLQLMEEITVRPLALEPRATTCVVTNFLAAVEEANRV